jgi:hypothetical protein
MHLKCVPFSGIMCVIGIWPIALVDFSFGPNLVRENKKLMPVSHKMSVTIDSNWDWRPLLDEFLGTLDWIVYGGMVPCLVLNFFYMSIYIYIY